VSDLEAAQPELTPADDSRERTADESDEVAAAVLRCPGVVRLSGGQFGQVATYLPGRRVAGVRLEPERAEVHVVARYGVPAEELAARIRAAVARAARRPAVDVIIDDVDLSVEP
jgi:uncharacterized alkaline shock family protein YloU